MDARSRSFGQRVAGFLLALGAAGCADFQGAVSPDAQRESRPDSDEPPLIVREDGDSRHAADAPESAETFGELILEYIRRVDQAESNKKRQAAADESRPQALVDTNPRRPAQLVFDPTEPPASTQKNTASSGHAVPDDGPGDEIATASANVADAVTSAQVDSAQADAASASKPSEAAAEPVLPAAAHAVRIRPAGDPGSRSTPDDTAEPAAINGALRARGAASSLREFLEQLPPLDDEQAPFAEQLDRRILLALAGENELAREPLPMASREQAEIAARFVESLITIREGHLGDPIGASTAALREIERLADALRQVSELSIGTLEICREVRAFGQYAPIAPAEFRTGVAAEFVLYCEVRDFTTRQLEAGQYEARFDLTTTILDHAGGEVLKFEDRDLVDRCRARRRDCFIPRLIRLPATLSPGGYVAKITLVDKLGDKVVERQVEFRVTAR